MRRLEISLGPMCNAACIFCQSRLASKDGLETEEVLRRLLEYKQKGYDHVEFTGGEPTLRDDLPFLIRSARKVGYGHVSLCTNLFRLSHPPYGERLISSGLSQVNYSLFTFGEEGYVRLTGVPDSFVMVRKALSNLKALDVRLSANVLISLESVHQLEDIAKLILDSGAVSLYTYYISVAEVPEARSLMVKVPDILPELRRFIDHIKNGVPLIRMMHIPPCLLGELGIYYFDERAEDIVMVDKDSVFSLENESFAEMMMLEACAGCAKAQSCAGIRKEYYELFGGEGIEPFR